MDFFPLHVARSQLPGQRFDPWAIEVEAMNHSARNIAALVDGTVRLIISGFRAIGAAVRSTRNTRPVEFEPVEVARPVQPALRALPDNDRVAA